MYSKMNKCRKFSENFTKICIKSVDNSKFNFIFANK